MNVFYKKLHPLAQIPKQATALSAGWDVVATEIERMSPYKVWCKLGFALGLPQGYKLVLVPRSSITKTNWILQNSPGIGDEDFIHEYQLRFITPIPNEPFPYNVGDRVGQIFLDWVQPIRFVEVDELEITERNGGFGSTGV